MPVRADIKQKVLGYCPVMHVQHSPLEENFHATMVMGSPNDVQFVDAVVFWGGTDINPAIYGAKAHTYNQASGTLSKRDEFELSIMSACRKYNVPIIGVCRGAQLACAFAGGSLVQHVGNHNGGEHMMVVEYDGHTEEVMTTSAHHQMMNPWGVEHQLVGWCVPRRSNYYQGESPNDRVAEMFDHPEPEIVYFPGIRALAIQGHPEWVDALDPFAQVCNRLIRRFLLEQQPVAA